MILINIFTQLTVQGKIVKMSRGKVSVMGISLDNCDLLYCLNQGEVSPLVHDKYCYWSFKLIFFCRGRFFFSYIYSMLWVFFLNFGFPFLFFLLFLFAFTSFLLLFVKLTKIVEILINRLIADCMLAYLDNVRGSRRNMWLPRGTVRLSVLSPHGSQQTGSQLIANNKVKQRNVILGILEVDFEIGQERPHLY